MPIKIALPKGRLLDETATLLQRASWGFAGYQQTTRFYHLKSQRFPNLSAKVFHEKDIPIQVAVGNYDLGICGLDWVEELLVKYPSLALVKVRNLDYGDGLLSVVASNSSGKPSMEEICAKPGTIRIASEYPNLAESFALKNRLRRFSIFPLWGAAEVYPPESADLALISGSVEAPLNYGLMPISNVLTFSAFLIANKHSWETKDVSQVVTSIEDTRISRVGEKETKDERHSSFVNTARMPTIVGQHLSEEATEDIVRLALPDGHQQIPAIHLLNKAGIQIDEF